MLLDLPSVERRLKGQPAGTGLYLFAPPITYRDINKFPRPHPTDTGNFDAGHPARTELPQYDFANNTRRGLGSPEITHWPG